MDSDECVLCMDRDTNAIFTCGHTFCETCARDWLQRAPRCPLCVEPVYRVALENAKRVLFLNPHVKWSFHLQAGVVSYVNSDAAREGLAKGDRVAYVNGQAPRDACYLPSSGFVVLDLAPRSPEDGYWCCQLFRAVRI